jgi:hypothetical protein
MYLINAKNVATHHVDAMFFVLKPKLENSDIEIEHLTKDNRLTANGIKILYRYKFLSDNYFKILNLFPRGGAFNNNNPIVIDTDKIATYLENTITESKKYRTNKNPGGCVPTCKRIRPNCL